MRFLSADYLFTLTSEPLKNGVLQVNNTGEIINIFNTRSGSFQIKSKSIVVFFVLDL